MEREENGDEGEWRGKRVEESGRERRIKDRRRIEGRRERGGGWRRIQGRRV